MHSPPIPKPNNDGKKFKWDERFFSLARFISTWSEDQSRKIGSVIVGDANLVLATGYNGLPRGVIDKPERHSKDNGEKYYWFEHAERNAIYNAARVGSRLSGARLYSTVFPCADCSRAIAQSGITCLIAPPPPATDEYFKKSFEASISILEEAGVTVEFWGDS